ncbi:MAG: hypothetical protein JNK76_05455 [Planctomycetales bacterium]|nr:hypothetical protein [Planctomycetales bacterium]MBN8626111.1 hypothetical protein [Planctomycetota bacterium]
MRCDEFLERWQDLLDERRDTATDVEAATHLQSCDGCRSLTEAFGRGMTQVRPAAIADMSGLADRVLASLKELPELSHESEAVSRGGQSAPRESRLLGRSWPMWAVAASVLLAIGVAWRTGLVGSPDNSANVPVAHHVPVPPVGEAQPLPTLVAADSSLGWEEFTVESETSAKQLVDDTRKRLDDALAIASLWNAGEEVSDTASDEAWYDGVAEGLSPLTDSTIGTWNTLRGLVAPSEEPKL